MIIAYYLFNRKPDGRNSCGIMVFIDLKNWAERNRTHKGATHDKLQFSRPASKEEIEEFKDEYRMVFFRYYDWNTLIQDEQMVHGDKYNDSEIAKQIEHWKKEYKLVPDDYIEQLDLFNQPKK